MTPWARHVLIRLSRLCCSYAATLLLRIAGSPGQSLTPEERMLCSKVSDALARMGQVRPHCRTLAALHSTRIRTLLATPQVNSTTPNSSGNSSGHSTPSVLPPVGYRLPQPGPAAHNPSNTPGYVPTQPGLGHGHAHPLSYSQPTTVKQELMGGLLGQQHHVGIMPPHQPAHQPPHQPPQQQQHQGAHPPTSLAQFSGGVTPPAVQGLFQAGQPGPHLWDIFGSGTGEWGQAGQEQNPVGGRGIMLPQVAGPFSVQNAGQGPVEWADWQQTEPGTWAW